MLTWEENQIQGTAAIMEKLQASVSVVGPSRLVRGGVARVHTRAQET